MTTDPFRLVAQLTSAVGSIDAFHAQFQNLKSITSPLAIGIDIFVLCYQRTKDLQDERFPENLGMVVNVLADFRRNLTLQ